MKGEIEAGGLRWARVLRGNRWNGRREVLGRGKKRQESKMASQFRDNV